MTGGCLWFDYSRGRKEVGEHSGERLDPVLPRHVQPELRVWEQTEGKERDRGKTFFLIELVKRFRDSYSYLCEK